MAERTNRQKLREIVKGEYAQAALQARSGGSSCCGTLPSRCGCGPDPITSNLYDAKETAELPPEVVATSLGCGNPTALTVLNPGETVLDLGSGGHRDAPVPPVRPRRHGEQR